MDKYICINIKCNKTFFRSPWHKKVRGGGKYCSKKCQYSDTKYKNKFKGKNNCNYKENGSKRYTLKGYVIIKINGLFIQEHRYVMEKFLGRKLQKNEVVHHINGIKDDNRIDNLLVMRKKYHDRDGKNYIEILQERIRFLESKLKLQDFKFEEQLCKV